MINFKKISTWLSLVLITTVLSACGQSDTSSDSSGLNLSGVWRQKSNGSLITIQQKDGKIDFIVDNDSRDVSLGDIDEKNKNVTIYVNTAENNRAVWTIRKIHDKAKEEDFLRVITHDGAELELNFVRNLTSDDLAKINTVLANKSTSTAINGVAAPAPAASSEPAQAVQTPAPAAASAAPAARGYSETIVRYSAMVLTQSGSNALMRSAPGRGNKVVQTLRDQENILVVGQTDFCEVIEKHNDCWYKIVTSKGKTGYLFGAYITSE